ncbi:MAG: hypothetical protein AAGA46_03190 [Cyanobacteria bacterium P01_F01_bin.13]
MTVFRSNIERVLTEGLKSTVDTLDTGYTTAIESPRYGWPGNTLRRSGELAGTTRNIVDQGAFRDSQEYRFINPFLAEFSWGGGAVDYAPQIFFGFTTRAGNSYPSRNPVAETHKITDPTGLFADNVRRFAA